MGQLVNGEAATAEGKHGSEPGEKLVEEKGVAPQESDASEPVTEISDQDYRSFFLPCDEFEEGKDDKSAA